MKQLEEENKRMKRMVADLSLDKQMPQDVGKIVLKPVQRRKLVDLLDRAYRVGIRRACAVPQFGRTSYYYRPAKVDDPLNRPGFTGNSIIWDEMGLAVPPAI